MIRSQLQVPEPWSGNLEHAPILFLSSNPSISTAELYPRWEWPDEEIADFFGRRFGGGQMGDNKKRRNEGKGEEDKTERMLAFLPHTNYRGARTFATCLPAGKLTVLRTFLS